MSSPLPAASPRSTPALHVVCAIDVALNRCAFFVHRRSPGSEKIRRTTTQFVSTGPCLIHEAVIWLKLPKFPGPAAAAGDRRQPTAPRPSPSASRRSALSPSPACPPACAASTGACRILPCSVVNEPAVLRAADFLVQLQTQGATTWLVLKTVVIAELAIKENFPPQAKPIAWSCPRNDSTAPPPLISTEATPRVRGHLHCPACPVRRAAAEEHSAAAVPRCFRSSPRPGHQSTGQKGLHGVFPPLAGSDFLLADKE